MKMTAQFEKENVDKTIENTGYIMVSLSAPEDESRAPITIAAVADVSTSMTGPCKGSASKLHAVKDTLTKLVMNMRSDDEFALILYGTYVDLAIPMGKVGNKETILRQIAEMKATSSTNLSGGTLGGYEEAIKGTAAVKRVILLTDGQPNVGVVDRTGLLKLVESQDKKATLTTIGFGLDADQELLADMAKTGGGNYYFIEDSQDSTLAFATELGGLASCYGQNIQVDVAPGKGVTIEEIVNDYKVSELADGKAQINAEDINQGEIKHILVKVKIDPAPHVNLNRAFSIAHVTVGYTPVATGKRVTEDLNVKVLFVDPDKADKVAKLEVAEQIALQVVAKTRQRAIRLASLGDYSGAQAEMKTAGTVLCDASLEGSQLASFLHADNQVMLSALAPESYTARYAANVEEDCRAISRNRSSKSGTARELYSNKAQKKAIENFTAEQVSSAAPLQVPTTPPKSSGFSKERKRN